MQVIVIQALGVLVFLSGSIWLGIWIRRHSTPTAAGIASRISHSLFWIALIVPGTFGLFYPHLTAYDEIIGVPGLPVRPVSVIHGTVVLPGGLGLTASSNRLLIQRGRGGAAFLLTDHLVRKGVYGWTRNLVALGFYAMCIAAGMIAGSSSATLGVLLIAVSAHGINLKYFEEYKLELRFGRSCVEYRRSIPFLIPRLRNFCGCGE